MRRTRNILRILVLGFLLLLCAAAVVFYSTVVSAHAQTWPILLLILAIAAQGIVLTMTLQRLHRRVLTPLAHLSDNLPDFEAALSTSRGAEPADDPLQRIARHIRTATARIHSQKQTKERLGNIISALASFVIVSDADGRITYCNERFEAILLEQGIKPERFLISALLNDELKVAVGQLIAEKHGAIELTTTWTFPNQSRLPVRLVATPYDSDQDRLLMMATDLTEWAAMQGRLESLEAERRQAETALHQSEARARELEWGILDIAEREQRRIGRDLHDGIGQRLTGITFLAKVLVSKLGKEAPGLSSGAQWIVALLNQTIDDLRRVSWELNPVGFEETDLGAALQRLTQDVTQTCGVACELINTCGAIVPNGATAMHIYRIIQEAINNSLRHGRSSAISVFLERRPGRIRIAVLDDGIGFDATKIRTGSGLLNMRARTEALNGRLRFRSQPNTDRGSVMIVSFPDPTRETAT